MLESTISFCLDEQTHGLFSSYQKYHLECKVPLCMHLPLIHLHPLSRCKLSLTYLINGFLHLKLYNEHFPQTLCFLHAMGSEHGRNGWEM